MYAVGKDLNTLVIDMQVPKFKPFIDQFSRTLLASPQFFTKCGVEMGIFDPYSNNYKYLCLYIANLNEKLLKFAPPFAKHYTLREYEDIILLQFLDPTSFIYTNLAGYCLLKPQPNGYCEIWDVCVLTYYRGGAFGGVSVGKNLISDIVNSGISQLFWLFVVPNNTPAAATYIKNGFRISGATTEDSMGVFSGFPSENIEFLCNVSNPNNPADHRPELEKFKKISEKIIELNAKYELKLFFPPETVADIEQLVNIDASEVGGRFVFKTKADGSVEETDGYYNLYVYDQLIKGSDIREAVRKGVRATTEVPEDSSMVFHTHPFSVILTNTLLIQIPSDFDVLVAYVRTMFNIKETFIPTIGGMYSLSFKKNTGYFMSGLYNLYMKGDMYGYDVLKRFYLVAILHYSGLVKDNVILSQILGSTLDAYKLLKFSGKKIDFKTYNRNIRTIAKYSCDYMNKLTLNDLFNYEETNSPNPVLRGFYRQYQKDDNFPFKEDRIGIFNLQFFPIKESNRQKGLKVVINNAEYDKAKVGNEPLINPRVKISPIGDCTRAYESTWWDKPFEC